MARRGWMKLLRPEPAMRWPTTDSVSRAALVDGGSVWRSALADGGLGVACCIGRRRARGRGWRVGA